MIYSFTPLLFFIPNCTFVFLSVKPIISSAVNKALVVAENVTVNHTWMVASNPKAVINITFMGQKIDPTVSRKTSRYGYTYTYTITSVNCNHAGVYSLRAANNIGSDINTLKLVVFCKYNIEVHNLDAFKNTRKHFI